MAQKSIKSFFYNLIKRSEVRPARYGVRYSNSKKIVSEETSMQVSAYYRGITYLATQVAKLPFVVKDYKNAVLHNDQITKLINLAPNSEQSSFHFKLAMMYNAVNHGNSFAEIERDTLGRAKNLWIIPTEWVDVLRAPSGDLVYRVNAESGNTIHLKSQDVFHIKNFHTKDGIIGFGLIPYAATILGISLASDEMAAGLFANGGIPSGVLTTPGALSDEAYARLKIDWDKKRSGENANSVAILEEGAKYESTIIPPDNLQFLETRQFNVLEIARFLGLPPSKLFDIQKASYASLEQSNLEVATDTLDAWCKSWESEVDIKLLNYQYGGRKSEMDLYEVFRGDMSARSNYFTKMMQSAALTPNEIRNKEGLAPYEGGDRLFIANNNYAPVDRIDEIIDSDLKKNEAVLTPEGNQADNQAEQDVENRLNETIINFLEK